MTPDQPPRPRPGPGRRRASRQVRLRRTIAGALSLCLVVAAIAAFATSGGSLRGVVGSTALPTVAGDTPRGGSTVGATAPAPRPSATGTPRGSVPQRASGRLRSVTVPGHDSTARGREVTYSVEIEQGLGADRRAFARTVRSVLTDPKGWETEDHVRFVHVSPARQAAGAHVDIRVTLASPALTDRICAPLKTRSKLDCFNGTQAVLNYRNWRDGIKAYGKDLTGYRTYLINHEVGHGLGFGHAHCHTKGTPAQVMIQQTISLEGCTPWPWPTRP